MEADLALLKRLEEYSLDDPNSTFPFSAKLAHEQGWTPTFTRRAIDEYKRFCYLAVTAGHPVSPSDVVDEVWHMHLTYSYEYWKVFCPEVLGKPFHHYPSTGGKEERAKFDEWFANTLASYREAFGEDPPADIWTPQIVAQSADFEQVNVAHHYIIRKDTVRTILQSVGLAAALLVFVGCADASAGNPLNYRGPEFLQFYAVLAILTFVGGHIAKWLLRTPTSGRLDSTNFPGPYEIAYLNGKSVLAVNAALTSLINQQALEFDAKSLKVRKTDYDCQTEDVLELTILKTADFDQGVKIPTIRNMCQSVVDQYHADLQRKGLLVTPSQGVLASWIGFIIAMTAPIYGLIKIGVGISRDRPVGFLIALCILSTILSLFFFIKPFRSRYGDQFLASLRNSKGHLKTAGRYLDRVTPTDVALGFALFGTAAMYGGPLEAQAKKLNPQAGSSSCGGGTSSCSSGGGDGGGGGCGGGCGGCGG